MKELLIEAKILERLQLGSYEEKLTMLDQAVSGNQDKFGDGDSVLFATFEDKVVVISEDGSFHSAKYKIRDGVVTLSAPELVNVDVLSEGGLKEKAVDDFFAEGSIAENLSALVGIRSQQAASPLQKLRSELDFTFSDGKLWRRVIDENREKISQYGWDARYGNLDTEVCPKYEKLMRQVEDQEDFEVEEDLVEDVVSRLSEMEVRLLDHLNGVKEAVETHQISTGGMLSDEDGQSLAQFDDFASDYVSYLEDVSGRVSYAIRELNEGGCVLCGALIHDEVARRYQDIDLASRFIRKVSDGFGQ